MHGMAQQNIVTQAVSDAEIEIAASVICQHLGGCAYASLDPKNNYRIIYRGVARRALEAVAAYRENDH